MTATHSFFKSRWIEVPGNVTETGGGLPRGFRAAGVACGIKPSGLPDLGLLVSSAPATTSAAISATHAAISAIRRPRRSPPRGRFAGVRRMPYDSGETGFVLLGEVSIRCQAGLCA